MKQHTWHYVKLVFVGPVIVTGKKPWPDWTGSGHNRTIGHGRHNWASVTVTVMELLETGVTDKRPVITGYTYRLNYHNLAVELVLYHVSIYQSQITPGQGWWYSSVWLWPTPPVITPKWNQYRNMWGRSAMLSQENQRKCHKGHRYHEMVAGKFCSHMKSL